MEPSTPVKHQMSHSSVWEVRITRSLGPHDFRAGDIDIYFAEAGVITECLKTTTYNEEFCACRTETEGTFATLKGAVESLARAVKAGFTVWAATRWIDPLLEVRPVNDGRPADRYVRLVTSTARGIRWTVDPADLHQPYGGSTTEPPLLRGNQGRRRGLVTQALVERAIDEADARDEHVGIIWDGGAASRYRLAWGQELAEARRETIAFVTRPPGDRSILGRKTEPI